ncbi:hypothetical protein BHM03_00019742 [Ensete ventricosum]|nr:hypothetical protein BHM03_00019742 [Ensete ventricosum]
MEQHDLTLASTRVYALDLCPRKAPCLRSMFQLLCQLPSYGLNTSPSCSLICVELIMALAITIPRVSLLLSSIFTSTLSVPSYDVALDCSPT